jgi:hypothetical protein
VFTTFAPLPAFGVLAAFPALATFPPLGVFPTLASFPALGRFPTGELSPQGGDLGSGLLDQSVQLVDVLVLGPRGCARQTGGEDACSADA